MQLQWICCAQMKPLLCKYQWASFMKLELCINCSQGTMYECFSRISKLFLAMNIITSASIHMQNMCK